MNKNCVSIVSPAGTSAETKFVLLAMVVTFVICGSVIGYRNISQVKNELPAWQINGFASLNPSELAIFNALISAGPEIEAIHADTNDIWPLISHLEDDFIPPFVKDSAWKKNGKLVWERQILSSGDNHIALYLGVPKDKEVISGSFLLMMMHTHLKKQGNAGTKRHAPYEIWFHPSITKGFPEVITDQAMISSGWKEVVARRGEDEMKRIKGKEF